MDAMTWGFIGTVVGAVTSIATTAITNWNSYQISQSTKTQDREERARSFQRETLLELQVELRKYIRCCSLIYRADRENFKETNKWSNLIPKELDEQMLDLNSKTAILIQRISNENLRSQLNELKTATTKCQLAENEYDAGAYHVSYVTLYDNVHEQLGKVLRNTY